MKGLKTRFLEHITQNNLFEKPDETIHIALSGGADSVALLLLLHECGFHTVALHCNFHLRGEESDRDEQFVRDLTSRLGVECIVKHFDTLEYSKSHKISIEMAARELRYGWFEEQVKAAHACGIAVAHHADDQAETILLNMVRGTGLRGLCGMKMKNGIVLRPLLPFRRCEIIDYLKEKNESFVVDSTNLEREAMRNIIRLDVLPLLKKINPRAIENIAKVASHSQEAMNYYRKGIEASLRSKEFSTRMPLKDFFDATINGKTLLHEWLSPYGFNTAQEEQILRDIEGKPGAIFFSKTHRLLRDRDSLILEPLSESQLPVLEYKYIDIPEDQSPIDFVKQMPHQPTLAYVDAEKIHCKLTLRLAIRGDRFRPYGMKQGTKLVSDFLTDRKLSLFDKERQTVLCAGDNIVWLTGQRIDDRYSVTDETKTILQIKMK